jgi:hypothetical protein
MDEWERFAAEHAGDQVPAQQGETEPGEEP